MVAGTTMFDEVRSVKLLFGSNDAGSIGSLNTTWHEGLTGTFVAPLAGFVDTIVGCTRLVPVPVVNDTDEKLGWALPVMSTTPVTLMAQVGPGARGTRGSNWMAR